MTPPAGNPADDDLARSDEWPDDCRIVNTLVGRSLQNLHLVPLFESLRIQGCNGHARTRARGRCIGRVFHLPTSLWPLARQIRDDAVP
jgi:hypothetical protein